MIFFFGIVTVLLLIVAMLSLLGRVEALPAGDQVKVAQEIRTKHGFDHTGAIVRHERGKRVLRIVYTVTRDAGAAIDGDADRRELEEVAAYAAEHYDGSDRKTIQEVRVTRNEIRGGGCIKTTLTAHHTLPMPEPGGPREKKYTRGVDAPP